MYKKTSLDNFRAVLLILIDGESRSLCNDDGKRSYLQEFLVPMFARRVYFRTSFLPSIYLLERRQSRGKKRKASKEPEEK